MKITRRKLGLAALLCSLDARLAFGQALPPGPIRFIIPYSPGSGSDSIARTAGMALGERLGRPVVVDNRPGASGMLGTEAVVRAAPNGSTLLVTASTMVINRALYPKASFDPLKDLTPIIASGSTQLLLVASAKSGFKDVADFLHAARAAPGKVNYGSPGIGTVHHLGMELFKIKTRTYVFHIPYSGAGQAVTGLLAGDIDVMFLPLTFALPHVKAGKLVPLAIASNQRHSSAPDVPTLAEKGVPDVIVQAWYGIYGPAAMPAELVTRLNTELKGVLSSDDMRQKFIAGGIDLSSSTPAELKDLGERDAARWAEVVRVQNIKPE